MSLMLEKINPQYHLTEWANNESLWRHPMDIRWNYNEESAIQQKHWVFREYCSDAFNKNINRFINIIYSIMCFK